MPQIINPLTGELQEIAEFITEWEKTKETAKSFGDEESLMRKALVKAAGLESAFGTFRLPVGDELGRNLKFTIAKKLEVEKGKDDEFEAVLEKIATIAGSGDWADALVKWRPVPVNAVFEKINEYARDHTSPHHTAALECRKLLDDVLILKPQSPQVVIEQPKP